eukprot:CAMPEP_0115070070 /NCGR_PEP_ID=MMETSP0227-20121206/12907_1 /TAXON_ID=89957 /ORGANISM="Polarella glacialis, Strain CCMP 1383" /LENGTH=36 /DNA_ID= /DNA_START= /DNA_END= /DNA_ORIENTATION=
MALAHDLESWAPPLGASHDSDLEPATREKRLSGSPL